MGRTAQIRGGMTPARKASWWEFAHVVVRDRRYRAVNDNSRRRQTALACSVVSPRFGTSQSLYGAVARRVRAAFLAGPSKDFPWAHRWSTLALLPVDNDTDVPPRSSGTSPKYHRKPHDRAVIVPSGHEALYRGPMSSPRVPGGVVHKLPGDLRQALVANRTALDAWKDITPLARNEFICWVEDAKQEMTRERRIRRTQEELEEGQRRPCCWPGCEHRERTGR